MKNDLQISILNYDLEIEKFKVTVHLDEILKVVERERLSDRDRMIVTLYIDFSTRYEDLWKEIEIDDEYEKDGEIHYETYFDKVIYDLSVSGMLSINVAIDHFKDSPTLSVIDESTLKIEKLEYEIEVIRSVFGHLESCDVDEIIDERELYEKVSSDDCVIETVRSLVKELDFVVE